MIEVFLLIVSGALVAGIAGIVFILKKIPENHK
jgi:hypothetical protein